MRTLLSFFIIVLVIVIAGIIYRGDIIILDLLACFALGILTPILIVDITDKYL